MAFMLGKRRRLAFDTAVDAAIDILAAERDLYRIDGAIAVDRVVRYDIPADDLMEITRMFGLPALALPHAKADLGWTVDPRRKYSGWRRRRPFWRRKSPSSP